MDFYRDRVLFTLYSHDLEEDTCTKRIKSADPGIGEGLRGSQEGVPRLTWTG